MVSIIMPAYNVEYFITDAINSVLEQSYQDWELIVIDDCSTDNTKNIIKTFQQKDTRIKPIFLNKNGGKPSIAKNIGLKKITGKYIAFLDSDDLWMPNKLTLQVKVMEENSECGLSYTGGYWINVSSNVIKSFLPKYCSGDLLHSMLKKYEINNQSVMITKKSLEDTLGQFNESITIGEDYNLFMHILIKYKAISIKDHLIKYRVHKNSITKSKKRISDGVLVTLNDLSLFKKYPLYSFVAYLKAIRFKFISK